MARPSKFSAKIVKTICEQLSAGVPLVEICRASGMPEVSNVWQRKQYRKEVSEAIARAREIGHDVIAARVRQTARGKGDSCNDVQRDKLIIETDLKLLAKWDPKRYGDAHLIKHADPDGRPLEMSDTERAVRLASIFHAINRHADKDTRK